MDWCSIRKIRSANTPKKKKRREKRAEPIKVQVPAKAIHQEPKQETWRIINNV